MRVLPFLLPCCLAACGKPPPPPQAAPPPPPTVERPLRTGTVEGFLRVDSDDIAPLTGNIRGFEKYCGQGPFDAGAYKVDPATRGLADAFIEADGRCAEFKSKDVPVLDQKACLFTPAMLAIPAGPVVFKNSDGMAHNVTIKGKLNPAVGEGFPGGDAISRTFPFEERLAVRCSIHPWMVAGLVVTRRAAHAITDAKGRFRIEGVEAGRRKLHVWHLMGEASIEVDVPAEGVVEIEIPWKPKAGFRAGFGR